MHFKKKYLVYIQGYDGEDGINDYEDELATFEDGCEDLAIFFAENYPFSEPEKTPEAMVVVERLSSDGSFEERIFERKIK